MLKLSTKCRYAVRALVELGVAYGGEPVSLREIGERQEISKRYLEHLVRPLQAAGFVESARGAEGGYTLVRDPASITMRHIIEVFEGPIAFVDCVDDADRCRRANVCPVRDVWREMSRGTAMVLEGHTLAELVACEKRARKAGHAKKNKA